jgi:hypothetical protein
VIKLGLKAKKAILLMRSGDRTVGYPAQSSGSVMLLHQQAAKEWIQAVSKTQSLLEKLKRQQQK